MTRPFSAAKLVDMMVSRFRTVFGNSRSGRTPELTPYELVTLASMIEKETGVGGERKLVSSVFHNRLGKTHAAAVRPDGDLRVWSSRIATTVG